MAPTRPRPRSATSSPAAATIRPSWPRLSAATGASRTACIGFSTSPFGKMTAGCAIAPPHATSPCYAKSLLTSSPLIAAVEPAFAVGARKPPGTTITCSGSSPARLMREPWGLIGSILQLLALDLAVPDHSTLSRRAETLEVPRPQAGRAPMHLLVDSTGLKFCGPGEWLTEKHGTKRRRAWRVLHLATDADTGRIVASVLTDKDADDGSQVGPLLDQIEGAVASVTGDGAYDRNNVYAEVATRHPAAAVVVPPRANAVPSETAGTAPTQRDAHLRCIAERGRLGWQKASGYNWRALVESDISRWKRVIGNGLRFQTDGRQASEVAIAVDVLNRMLNLGRPEYVRIA